MKTAIILLFLFSCARAPLELKRDALVKVENIESITDDLEIAPFLKGIKDSIIKLKNNEDRFGEFHFGEKVVYKEEYVKALEKLLSYSSSKNKDQILDYIVNNFDFYHVYGREKVGEVLITGYFAPLYKGSKKPTKTHHQALFKLPKDMVEVSLESYKESDDYNLKFEDVEKRYVIGRLDPEVNDRGARRVIPYYSREQIDMDGALDNKGLELVYIDPVDAFFLHIQGSGVIEFKNGDMLTMGYSGQNGRKYEALGKFLLDEIPLEQMSMEKIEHYLRGLNMQDQYEFMAKNPSYVFFRPLKGRPVTTLGTSVVDGRTIATDGKFFTKGAIGYLKVNDENGEKFSRLVLDHDTGGAIYGGGRVDLFWGLGKSAQLSAGSMREMGQLFILAPK
ncbi:MAG: MltA domain-containing protein [Bacteriovoracaceae bacterium]